MYERYIKRPLDCAIALVALVLLALPMLIIAIWIKRDSPGPVFYRQQRTGKGGQSFIFLKFRSTPPDNDVYDKTQDNKFTEVGKFLRKTSLDELPQFIHVVKGEMSLIGPRAWITAYHDHMTGEQRRRYDVRPGITGIAQVYGRNKLSIHQKISYDLRYVDHIGLREDLKVIFLTVKAVLTKEGQEMGKGGIHEELDILRLQFSDSVYGSDAHKTSYSDSKSNEAAI